MRFCTVTLIASSLSCGSGSHVQREFDGNTALSYVETQVAFGPRVPNTDAHRRTGDWIFGQLRSRADSAEVQHFRHVSLDGDTLELRNFFGRFRPAMADRILLVAHWDTRPRADESENLADQMRPVPGANDGASGVAILLGVADVLKAAPPAVGVDLLFVDGEDYGDFGADKDVLIGSRFFADSTPSEYEPLFVVLFDMVGDADLRIFQEAYSVSGAPEVVERVWRIAHDLGYRRVFRSTVSGGIVDDHLPLQRRGMRSIVIIDFDYPYWHTTEDTLDKVSAASLQIVGDVAVALTR